jgi:hypothetical protein
MTRTAALTTLCSDRLGRLSPLERPKTRAGHTLISVTTPRTSRNPSLESLALALGKLSRKSSAKIKKSGTGGGDGDGIAPESERGNERITKDDEVGRPSLQGRRSTSLPSKQRSKKPLGILIDNSDAGMVWDSSQSASTPYKVCGVVYGRSYSIYRWEDLEVDEEDQHWWFEG